MNADFSHTCEGCEHVVTEPWAKDIISYRCFPRGLHSKAPYLCNTRRRRAAGNQPRGGSQNGGSHARNERRKSAPSYRGGEIKEE